jgi:tetratricopeptide (TPR) repeat protein
MAGSVLAESDASSAPFWNPSNLATAQRYSLAGMHSRLFFPGNVYQYFGATVPTLDQGGFGLGIFRQGVSGIEKRDANNQVVGETQDNIIRVHVAHGRSWSGYDLGLATTLEYHSLDGLSAMSSPGLDVSAGKRFTIDRQWLRGISSALNIRNLLRPGLKLAESRYHYYLEMRAGLAFHLYPTSGDDHRLLLATSLTETQSVSAKIALGLEYTFMDLLSVRGGLESGKTSVGLGIKYQGIGFDYAIVDRDFGSIHLVSLTTFFGRSKSERISERARKRDAEFRAKMNSFFTDRNSAVVEELIASGKRHMDSQNFIDAVSDLDRAMFLARTYGADTGIIINLVSTAREQLEQSTRRQQYSVYIDSARTCAARQDHIATKYFAGQALLMDPESDTAQRLYSRASQVLAESTSRNEMITNKLATVDSLLDGKQFDLASSMLKSLEEIAAGHEGVLLRSTKLQFELLKRRINDPTSYADYSGKEDQTREGIDSAGTIPRESPESTLANAASTHTLPDRVLEQNLSSQLRKEIDAIYNAARQHLEQGQLDQAVGLWERVERSAPGYKSVREYLVKAYTFVGANLYAQKRREEALVAWNKASRLDPGNSEVLGYIQRTRNEISRLKALSYDE